MINSTSSKHGRKWKVLNIVIKLVLMAVIKFQIQEPQKSQTQRRITIA